MNLFKYLVTTRVTGINSHLSDSTRCLAICRWATSRPGGYTFAPRRARICITTLPNADIRMSYCIPLSHTVLNNRGCHLLPRLDCYFKCTCGGRPHARRRRRLRETRRPGGVTLEPALGGVRFRYRSIPFDFDVPRRVDKSAREHLYDVPRMCCRRGCDNRNNCSCGCWLFHPFRSRIAGARKRRRGVKVIGSRTTPRDNVRGHLPLLNSITGGDGGPPEVGGVDADGGGVERHRVDTPRGRRRGRYHHSKLLKRLGDAVLERIGTCLARTAAS